VPKKKAAGPPAPRYVSAEGKWTVRFQEDPNAALNPGDVEVISEFARPPEAGDGAGSKTQRISTSRKLGLPQTTTKRDTTANIATPANVESRPDALARFVY